MSRLGFLALVAFGIAFCPLFAGLEFSHVHRHGERAVAHHHPHAGHHRHADPGDRAVGDPRSHDEDGRDEDGRDGTDPVVGLSDGSSMLPVAVAVRVATRVAPAAAPPLRRGPRPVDVRAHRSPRAPPG